MAVDGLDKIYERYVCSVYGNTYADSMNASVI